MYEIALCEAWDLFGDHLSGKRSALVCVVSERGLDDRSKAAFESSAEALGYGNAACAFATLRPADRRSSEDHDDSSPGSPLAQEVSAKGGDRPCGPAGGAGPQAASAGEGAPLDEQALFLLIEGLDPLCLVAADEQAAHALARTYRCDVPLGRANRAFGRSCVAFRSFPRMLEDGQDKQIAWALLKKLPRFGER